MKTAVFVRLEKTRGRLANHHHHVVGSESKWFFIKEQRTECLYALMGLSIIVLIDMRNNLDSESARFPKK